MEFIECQDTDNHALQNQNQNQSRKRIQQQNQSEKKKKKRAGKINEKASKPC